MTTGHSGTPMQRLFFALWLDEFQRTRLAELANAGHGSTGRPVPAENLHLTLAFLGNVGPDVRACMENAAEEINSATFELVFTHLGYWPRPRVLWAGTESVPDALLELVSVLRAGMSRCGLCAESRPYRAHVTLARKARAAADFHLTCAPVHWPVNAFHLVESKTLSSAASYRILRSWPLAA